MSDSRAIGVFDSGIGGLTVLRALRQALPDERTVYLGDVARCPYGPRPQAEVRRFAHQIADFLLEHHDIKLLVVACNTASAAALESLRARYITIPVLGVIEPGARAAVSSSRRQRIGVMATPGTIGSGAYTRAVQAMAPEAQVTAVACPALVPLVESGETYGPHAERLLRDYLTPLHRAEIDTLILGCTHYPLLRPTVDAVAGAAVAIVDSAATTASEVAAALDQQHLRAPHGETATRQHSLYTTGAPSTFSALAGRLFGETFTCVERVDLSGERPGVAGRPPACGAFAARGSERTR